MLRTRAALALALAVGTSFAPVSPLLGTAFGQATRPSIAFATTPKDALKQLNDAMREGDRLRIISLMDAKSPLEASMVDAMASMAEALAGLQRASTKAFGPLGAKDVTGDDGARWSDGQSKIDSAEVKLDGDVATVIYRSRPPTTQKVSTTKPTLSPASNDGPPATAERSEPVSLVRVNGVWKLPVSQLAAGADPAALKLRLAELAVQTKLVQEVTEEIAAGKYETAEKAADAWHSRFMQSLSPKPATQPLGK
jgi:hypothetical protein